MNEPWLALLLGGASGLLALTSFRVPLLGWLAFAPLGVAVAALPPGWAALAGATAGALANGRDVADRTLRVFGVLAALISAVVWGTGFAIAAALLPPEPVWLSLALPLTVVAVHLPLRLLDTPRWHNNPLAQAQARFLAVVHTAKVGGDLTPTALLALAGAATAMLLIDPAPHLQTVLAASACVLAIAVALLLGRRSFVAAARRAEAAPTVRVAAVVVNGRRPEGAITGTWPVESDEYGDPAAHARRYEPHIDAAVRAGAELIVLPEVGITLERATRQSFIDTVAGWARARNVAIVAPFFDASIPKNELVVIDATGSVAARYEKQHPVAHVEGKREKRMRPGPVRLGLNGRELALSTVICVDLDYGDLVAPVRAAGGILVAPSNDWPDFDELHHQSAVWSAVTTGVSVVRATGWGISAVFDGAGRVLARDSSLNGPVMLAVDVPVAQRSAGRAEAPSPTS